MDNTTNTPHTNGYTASGCTVYTGSKIMSSYPSLQQGEKEMAEVDTSMLAGQHADIRREQAVGFGDTRYNIAERTGDIRREVAASADQVADITLEQASNIRREQAIGFGDTRSLIMEEGQQGILATKDARADIGSQIASSSDRATDRLMELRGLVGERFYTVGRDLADIRQGQATLARDVELHALKGIIEGQKNTTYLSDKISAEGAATRGLINDLKYHDLNRGLIERNAELVEERNWGRHWYHGANQAQFGQQFAQLQSQMQNFNSQLAETRQGMVNFGTMSGNAGQQTASTNNVR
jgi:hypothetical protein